MNTTLEDASTAHRSRTSALSERCDRDGDIKILKERLDTIIIFAGLFAGVNSLFLTLTLPELSFAPVFDAGALTAWNNGVTYMPANWITVLTASPQSPVQSTVFYPSNSSILINVLFTLSLSCTLMSAFLAVLGQQGLTPQTRKQSDPSHDRADPWFPAQGFDHLPSSLNKTGIILFFISLTVYLYHLNPTTSIIVGIPLFSALAGCSMLYTGYRISPRIIFLQGIRWLRGSVLMIRASFKDRTRYRAIDPTTRSNISRAPSDTLITPLEGDLQLGKRIASGACGEVYMGTWTRQDKPPVTVAIKCIKRIPLDPFRNQLPGEDRHDRRVLREIVIWENANHESILPFLGYQTNGTETMLVSSWCKNGTLSSYVLLHPELEDIDKLKLIRGAARGLAHLHSSRPPVVHGDIKADNFLVSDEVEVVLADFGVSRLIMNFGKSGLTTNGQGTGSPGHQAKELFKEDSPPTPASDIYAFGGVILTVMTGKPPFHGIKNNLAIIIAVNNDETPAPADHPNLDEHDPLWDLMRKCWDPDPTARPDIGKVIEEIENQIQVKSPHPPHTEINMSHRESVLTIAATGYLPPHIFPSLTEPRIPPAEKATTAFKREDSHSLT